MAAPPMLSKKAIVMAAAAIERMLGKVISILLY
jgi:hypothetical protein